MTRDELLEFLRSQRLAVVSSVASAGAPQAALVGIGVSERFEIVFDTLASTRKAANVRRDGRVALVIGGWLKQDERTVQLEGLADEPGGADLERLKLVYYAAYPEGPNRANWPGLIYVRVRPQWIRYSDFNRDPPLIVEFRAEDLTA